MAGFKKAQRTATKFKGSIQGASGSGKTYSALKIATALVALTDPGKRIAVIDTEKSSDAYSPPFDFDVDSDFGEGAKLSYDHKTLLAKLETARKAGTYGVVVIDSMTHFWKEQGGFTRQIDSICDAQRARGGKGDSFAAWKQVDPLYRELMTYIRQYPLHVILGIRAKQGYEDVVENGRKKKVKVGMEPEFREGFEFELDAQFAINELDGAHLMVPLKHRLDVLLDGKTFRNPGEDVAALIHEWLMAAPAVVSAPAPAPAPLAKTTAPEPTPVEQPANDTATTAPTEPAIPAASPSSPSVAEPSPVEALKVKLAVCATMADLQAVAVEIKASLKDKKITLEEYNGVLSPAYGAKQKELKGSVAA